MSLYNSRTRCFDNFINIFINYKNVNCLNYNCKNLIDYDLFFILEADIIPFY